MNASSSNGVTAAPQLEPSPNDLALVWKLAARGQTTITATFEGEVIHVDSLNISVDQQRKKFQSSLEAILDDRGIAYDPEGVATKLINLANEVEEVRDSGGVRVLEQPTFVMIDDDSDELRAGMYRRSGGVLEPLANFTARVTEDVVIEQEDRPPGRIIRGLTRLRGEERHFELAPRTTPRTRRSTRP